MRRRLGILVSGLLMLGTLVLLHPPAALADTTCTGAGVAGGQTVAGNLVVPTGLYCHLFPGSKVTGNVTVQPNSNLYAEGARINGQVIGNNADVELILGTSVGGKVTINDPISFTGPSDNSGVVCGSTIGGSLTVRDADDNSQPDFHIYGGPDCNNLPNRINGAVLITNNVIRVRLYSNSIGGSLTCTNNAPDPIGANNNVAGAIYGTECASFEGP